MIVFVIIVSFVMRIGAISSSSSMARYKPAILLCCNSLFMPMLHKKKRREEPRIRFILEALCRCLLAGVELLCC
jgi:hypothetical protein